MKYFTFPNLPNDVWLGSIDEPDKCKLVCSCPSDGPMKAVTVAALLQLEVDTLARDAAAHEARHARHQLSAHKTKQRNRHAHT